MVNQTQTDVLLTLLQFVALSIPAVAILLQVVLQFQSQHVNDDEAVSGWEFRAIEISFLALVLGGVLLAVPIIQLLSSPVSQFGVGLSLLALLLLVFATGVSLRRPRYPTEEYESIEKAIVGRIVQVLNRIVEAWESMPETVFLVTVAVQFIGIIVMVAGTVFVLASGDITSNRFEILFLLVVVILLSSPSTLLTVWSLLD